MRALAILALLSALGCARRSERPLVIAYPAGLHSTDVNDPAHEQFATAILANVYERLVEVEPDLSLRPGLAESWYSPDELTWVFKLRPRVRMHDSRLLTAADVAASFERARQSAWMRSELGAVAKVEARGDLEVVFSTRAPFNTLPQRLTYLFVTGGPDSAGTPAPGTGPYRIRSWQASGTTVLEAFSGYRDGPPPMPVVRFETVPAAHERARLLRSGAVHVITDVLPEEMEGTKVPGVSFVATPGLRTVFLAMDCAHERSPYVTPEGNPFRDRRVREAVALAIDRGALVAGPLHGNAEGIDQLANPSEMGFDPSLRSRAVDLDAARRLLAAAAPHGFDVQLDYMPGKYLAVDAVVEALAAQLARIGVRAHPRASPPAEHIARVERQDTSLYLLGWLNESRSVQETYASLLHSPRDGFGATNGGGYANAELDALLDAAPVEYDIGKRVEELRRATRIVDTELPIVPLYREKALYAFASSLAFEPHVYAPIRVAQIHWKD